jgi:hypothetical protein
MKQKQTLNPTQQNNMKKPGGICYRILPRPAGGNTGRIFSPLHMERKHGR